MAKQSPKQQATVERVMHEFKEGDLKSGSGDKVRDPKQAIAIALSEAGASNRATPAQNARRRRATGKREQAGERSKADLMAEARRRDIPGRSRMTKAELARALAG